MTTSASRSALIHSRRGASLAEYGILLGLISVLGIGAVAGLGLSTRDTFDEGTAYLSASNEVRNGEFESIEAALEGTVCETGTETVDLFDQLGPRVNCVYLLGGDDTLDVHGASGIAVWPGLGDDYLRMTAQNATIHYEGGNDLYETNGLGTSLDLSRYALADLSFRTGGLDPQNTKNKGWLSYDIVTPDGRLRIENGMIGLAPTTYGIQSFALAEGEISQAEIRQIVLDGQAAEGLTNIYGTALSDVMTGGAGNQKVYLGEGDDDYTWVSGNETIDASKGADRIRFQDWSYADVTLDIYRRDLLVSQGGTTVTLDDQARYETGHANALFAEFVFEDATVSWPELAVRAVADQSQNGASLLEGTAYADTLRPTGDTLAVSPAAGDDRIIYSGGTFEIYGDSNGFFINPGYDTLEMTGYASGDATFAVSGNDITVTTAGGEITLRNQALTGLGENPNLTIDQIQFSDVTWQEAEIRAAAGL